VILSRPVDADRLDLAEIAGGDDGPQAAGVFSWRVIADAAMNV
jgi:hypothetical protein